MHDAAVAKRIAAVTPDMGIRKSRFAERAQTQRERFHLPAFPTTTIGSFPQTAEVRKARAAHGKGSIGDTEYKKFLYEETGARGPLAGRNRARCAGAWRIRTQRHGAVFRRTAFRFLPFTSFGWVQSYGSRCVRPPILFGDVSRPKPMDGGMVAIRAVADREAHEAMLTGPVTILNWSFVRDDIPRSASCRQIALAIRDEVSDLERAGARMIQIDEAALREGLPLRRRNEGLFEVGR